MAADTSRLTVNAGLRYDVQKFAQPPVRNPDAQLAAAGIDTSVLNTDTNNWGPRSASPGRRSAAATWCAPATVSSTAARRRSWWAPRTRTTASTSSDDHLHAAAPVPTYPNTFASIPHGRDAAARRPSSPSTADFQNARLQQASVGVEWRVCCRNTSMSVSYLFVARRLSCRARPTSTSAPRRRRTFTVVDNGKTAAALPVRRQARSRTSRASSRSRARRSRATTG